MILLLVWALGIGVGVAAARTRGFGMWTGAGAGLLLGPVFAWLLFIEMGYGKVTCTRCGTKAEASARFCKRCDATLPDPYAEGSK